MLRKCKLYTMLVSIEFTMKGIIALLLKYLKSRSIVLSKTLNFYVLCIILETFSSFCYFSTCFPVKIKCEEKWKHFNFLVLHRYVSHLFILLNTFLKEKKQKFSGTFLFSLFKFIFYNARAL